jgi:non-canonical (house-cleaning) NTP pyrophosphatase
VKVRGLLGAELGVGIEGRVVEQPDGSMRTCVWAVIVNAASDSCGRDDS